MKRPTALLLLLLLLPTAHALTTDKDTYTQGDTIEIQTADGLTIQTPAASYTLLGTDKRVAFPTSSAGNYTFRSDGKQKTVTVLPARTLTLETARGATQTRAADHGTHLSFDVPGLGHVQLHNNTNKTVRITPSMGKRWGFTRTYAVDPTTPGFGTATITATATGDALYKCAEYNYTEERCEGSWAFQQKLVPGQKYTITVAGADPAFGEGDSESEPDACRYWDEAGVGDSDSDVACLTEVQTEDGGTSTDMEDEEGTDVPSEVQINYTNSLAIASINSVNVTYRYQRLTSTEVGSTTATIEVLDSGAYTTACTDTVTEGAWETITCDLGTWVTTEAEANNIRTRILFSTAKSQRPGGVATTYIDYSYLSMDYVYDDRIAPSYDNITAQASSPKTYDAQASNFSADWTDDIAVDTALIEHNFTGTLQNETVTGPPYQHSEVLGAGSYVWRQIANDTSGNQNETPQQTYTVEKATGEVKLELNGTHGNLTINEDNTIPINGTRIAGEATMTLYEDGAQIASGNPIDISRTYNTPGTYTLTLNMTATQNYTYAQESWNLTVLDTTPPATVTGLANLSADTSWIYWNWTNPADTDFSHTVVEINETFYANTTNSYYNATGLSAGSDYEIQTRTVDNSGNVNETYVNDTASTDESLDFDPPNIENVTDQTVTDSEATITWDTDEDADTLVKYGTSSGTYTETAYDATDTKTHSTTLTGLTPETTYYYVANSTDPADNTNQSTEHTFTTGPDATPPEYSDEKATPASPQTYPATVEFNTTWTDNGQVDTAVLEHNFSGEWQNETMSGGPEYTLTKTLGAGAWGWRSHANDTAGNQNTSMPVQTYTVSRADGNVTLLLNGTDGDLAVDEDTQVNITGKQESGEGEIELFENGTLLQKGVGTQTHLKTYDTPGTYNITARQNQTQNYTEDEKQHTLTVNDITPPSTTLNEPFDDKTETQARITFTFEPVDNVQTDNCTLQINGTDNRTNTSITDGATNNITTTMSNGEYFWTVSCTDTSGNTAQATPARNLTVNIIEPWIPTNATHNNDGTVTGLVNESDGSTSTVGDAEQVDATAWSSSAPSNANITAVDAACEIDSATRGATLHFQYNNGSGWSGDVCSGPQDGIGTFTCDLYSEGIDTVTELNTLDVRCRIQDTDGGPSATAELDYMEVQPDWNLIELPDFNISKNNLSFPTSNRENEQVLLNATVHNDGDVGADAKVRFWDSTRSELIGEQTKSVPAGGHTQFNTTWTAALGPTNITVIADPDGVVDEHDETNNNASDIIHVSAWQTYYGSTEQRFKVLSDDIDHAFNWSNDDLSGNIYATDTDADVSMLNLQALTRTPGGTYAFADLADADTELGMTGYNDSINRTFSDGTGGLLGTESFTVFGATITDVPTINSTNTSAFRTGVLYDADDDTNSDYDGEEDLVFVTKVNRSQPGAYGTYDYEIRVPALLRNDTAGTSSVDLFIEVT